MTTAMSAAPTLPLFIWCAFLSYGAVLTATAWRRRQTEAGFKWLLWVLAFATLNQTVLLIRILNLKPYVPWLIGIRLPLQLFIVAFAYLFFHSFLRRPEEERLPWIYLLGPPILGIFAYLEIQMQIRMGTFVYGVDHELRMTFGNLFRAVLLFGYTSYILFQSNRDRRLFEVAYRAQNSNLIKLRLPVLQIIWFTILASGVAQTIDFLSGPQVPLWPFFPLLALGSEFALVQYALVRSSVFNIEDLKVSNGRERVSPEEMAEIERRLRHAFVSDKIYLDPDLRLANVAQLIHVPAYKISSTLSSRLGTNFFEFVNQYRIEHAQDLMNGEPGRRMNLVGIGLDSGFNSKSVFNEAFKRTTGMTPSEFRRQNRPTY